MNNSNIQATELRADIVDLTPELAGELLLANTSNRRLGNYQVIEYSRMIEEGLWSDGVAVVAVSTEGVLVNGQHVCHAVLKSGIAVKAVLVTGISPASFAAFDSHGKRTSGQTLALSGVKNANVVAAIIRRTKVIETGNHSVKITNAEANAQYESDPQLWDDLAAMASEVYRIGRTDKVEVTAPAVGAFLHSALQIGHLNEAYEFALSVPTVSGHEQGNAVEADDDLAAHAHRRGCDRGRDRHVTARYCDPMPKKSTASKVD